MVKKSEKFISKILIVTFLLMTISTNAIKVNFAGSMEKPSMTDRTETTTAAATRVSVSDVITTTDAGTIIVSTKDSYFTVDKENKILTDYDIKGGKNAIIPVYIDGVEILEIEYDAFRMKGMESVAIPSTVILIPNGAFGEYEPGFKGVTIKAYINSYANSYADTMSNAFVNLTSKSFVYDDTGTLTDYIGSEWIDLILPEAVDPYYILNIGDDAFANNAFETVMFHHNIKHIGARAFQGNKLEVININAGIKSIGEKAFSDNKIHTVIIAKSVEKIHMTAFDNNQSDPKDLTIKGYSGSVANSFADDNGYTFEALAEHYFEFSSDSNCILGYDLDKGGRAVVIPSKIDNVRVRYIDTAFENKGITSLVFPDYNEQDYRRLDSIGYRAFYGNKLKTLKLPKYIFTIAESAFQNNELTSLEFDRGVNEIFAYAFADNLLTELKFETDDNLYSIGDYAFANNNLSLVILPNFISNISPNAFDGNQSNPADLVFRGVKDSTESIVESYAAEHGYTFKPYIYIFDPSTATINYYYKYMGLDVVIPDEIDGVTVEIIDIMSFEAFPGVDKIKSLLLPKGLKEIRYGAFMGNELKEVTILDTVTRIDEAAFSYNQSNNKDFIIKGYKGSVAESHAKKNGYTFVALDKGTSDSGTDDGTVDDDTSSSTGSTSSSRNKKDRDNRGDDKESIRKEIEVVVNGHLATIGKETIILKNDETTTTIIVDRNKINSLLNQSSGDPKTIFSMDSKSDRFIGKLTGEIIKMMADVDAVIEMKMDGARYILPVKELSIEEISKKFGNNIQLDAIKVEIEISKPSKDALKLIQENAKKDNYTLVSEPISFNVTCIYGGKRIKVDHFTSYVERVITLPNNIDPSKITTGVIVEVDGTLRHVPTKITMIDGHYVAKINSLTNSVYSIIYHPLKFADVEGHWAKEAINDLGSRMVVVGDKINLYHPDNMLSHREFSQLVLKALGINERDENKTNNKQLNKLLEESLSLSDYITRKDASIIIAEAMKLTSLDMVLSETEVVQLLEPLETIDDLSKEEKICIARILKVGIIIGRDNNQLALDIPITKAEAAVIIRRLLQKSNLI